MDQPTFGGIGDSFTVRFAAGDLSVESQRALLVWLLRKGIPEGDGWKDYCDKTAGVLQVWDAVNGVGG